MYEKIHEVVVTSPLYELLSTLQHFEPSVLVILVGKALPERLKTPEPIQDAIEQLRRESHERDIVALAFEPTEGGWIDVPVEKVGTGPYLPSAVAAANFFNSIRRCGSNEEQQAYLKELGLAIDEQFVGC